MALRGHCLCKKLSWECSGAMVQACYCHCDSCRRNCAAPVVAWLGVQVKHFKWGDIAPKIYESSKGVWRHFCDSCGTPMGLKATRYPGEIYLYAASLENPEDFTPTFHVSYESKISWLSLADTLKKYDGILAKAPFYHRRDEQKL